MVPSSEMPPANRGAASPGAPAVLFLCTGNYFRSRFAEELFNHLAAERGLAARASSAGLEHACHLRNPGPISPHTAAGLRARGLALDAAPRPPRDITEEELAQAPLIVAMKGAEHRPMVQARFPAFARRIRYWDVDDLPDVAPGDALAKIEALVRALLEELAGSELR
jgi:protein-tyrosine phosphatase